MSDPAIHESWRRGNRKVQAKDLDDVASICPGATRGKITGSLAGHVK